MPFFTSKPTTEDLTGLASFFDFLCAVFSRISYTEAPMPLFLLSGVFRIIPKELLDALNQITNISELNGDEVLLQKLNNNNTIPLRTYNGKKYIDFIPYAEKINNLIEDTLKSPYYKKETDSNIKVISIADSNYGDVLIIGIKYLSNFVFTSFRGTYSTKTAQSYIQLSSLNPVEISEGKKVLKGIAKIEFEILHAILAANNDIVTTFLQSKNVIPVFTGHSLGGALATLLDYEYCSIIEKKGEQIFSPLSGMPVCISFGAPRLLSKTTSEKLCSKIVSNKTLFHRYSNDGDPVTALPPPNMGFYHPCSSKNDKNAGNRKLVSRDCKSSSRVSSNLARSDYTKAINCRDVEPSIYTKTINAGPNIFDHMTYLYISFAKAADVVHLFGKSALTINTTEIGRVKQSNAQFNITSGDTEMRIVQMTGTTDGPGYYTVDFIDLAKVRKKGDNILNEDSFMTKEMFSDLLYSKQDKVDVSFKPDGLPVSFNKSVPDEELEDEEDRKYIEDLKSLRDNSFVEGLPREEAVPVAPAAGGKRKSRKGKRKVNKLTKKKLNKKNKSKIRRY